jgi:DNA-binding response OmpR family regulator
VPSKTPTESSGNPTDGILLVEEYSALRVAITSALRKFAPLHGVRVARSFAEAEAIAAVMRPELFLLDLDPPPLSGEIAFFNKLKTQHPDARVLVIASGTSRELRAERGTSGAIQFIEKPFDLAEFGAAVQALLGPWALPHTTHLRGTLRDLHLVDIVQLKCLAFSSAVVRLELADGTSGAIYFRKGQICHAITGLLIGAPALEEIATWPDGHLSETDLPGDVPASINVAWPVLLLPIVRQLAEENKKSFGAAPPPASAVAETGKKILIIDDTEMLLIFVEDTLATADETLQITTASTGAEGIHLAASAHPDLILLDYSLTDMTGDRVCHALLEKAATARIPVLMMSGHVSEMAQTARDYGNVVASLPKPFLSGALISEVERVLAAGPLPMAPRAPSISKVAPSPPAPASSVESQAEPLLGGDCNGDSVASTPPVVEEPPTPPISELPKSSAVRAAKSVATEPQIRRAREKQPPAPVVAASIPGRSSARLDRRTEVSVTLAVEVVSMQLTPSFRMEAATLQLCDPMVSVKMGDQAELSGVPLKNGFRLGAIQLFDDGRVDTIRLVPTHQPPQLPAAKSSFAIGSMRLEQTNSDQNLQFTAPANETMRVLLTAQCELLAVELSVAFEVVAVILRAPGGAVLLRNGPGSDGAPFVLAGVDLNPAAELRALLVRAVT